MKYLVADNVEANDHNTGVSVAELDSDADAEYLHRRANDSSR